MILSPNDNQLADNASDITDSSFGGNREFTTGTQQKSQDYKRPVCGNSNTEENPVDETIRDIDDMTDPKARKREFSRRAETWDRSDHNKERFAESEPDNRPNEDTGGVIVPDEKFHGDRLKNQFGSGQYDNNPNRGGYEGEVK